MFDTDLLPLVAKLSPTIMWISLTVGILLYIIGYFAGGRMTMSRIMTCTMLVTVIGVLALPAPMVAYRVVKKQYGLVAAREKEDGSITKITSQVPAGTSKADSQKVAQNASNGENELVPVTFQVLTLVMYIIWTAFLVGMGIFFYETLIVTAEEIDKR
jgi:hypothetical protein